MDGTISHVVGHDTTALVTLHDEVHGEVLDEEDAIVSKGTSEECVQHGVTCAISDGAASVCLATLAVISGLSTESSLVDLAISSSAERHTVGLKLTDSDGCFSSHVLDSILVTEPVGSLDGVIEMVSPIIRMHVSECSVDTALGSDSMGSGGEQLGDASGLESSFRESEGSSESSTTGTDDDPM